MQLIYVLILYPALLLNLLVLIIFVECLRSSTCKIILSTNRDNFTSFFPIWMSFMHHNSQPQNILQNALINLKQYSTSIKTEYRPRKQSRQLQIKPTNTQSTDLPQGCQE